MIQKVTFRCEDKWISQLKTQQEQMPFQITHSFENFNWFFFSSVNINGDCNHIMSGNDQN